MTKKPKKAPKLKAKTPKGLQDRLANARKLGERQEKTTELLSPSQIEGIRERVCNDLREIDNIKEKIKTSTAELKARKTELEASVRDDVRVVNAGKRDVDITVEEWLTPQNEVIRVRTDSGEVIGARTAKLEELQEELFEEDGDEDDDASDEIEKTATDAREAGDADGNDFGAH